MNALLKKLNYKGEKNVLVLNAPQSFYETIETIKKEATVYMLLENDWQIDFAIVFVVQQNDIDTIIPIIAEKIDGDKTIWFCYPKKTSKKFHCEIDRDNGWSIMGRFNFEPVRQVSIDDDWSAIRFRNVEFIKNITRKESFALTDQAKERTTQKGK